MSPPELETSDKDDATSWFEKGLAHEGVSEFPQAIEAYRKVIETDPDYSTARYHEGSLLVATGRSAEALPLIRKAMELDTALARDADALGVLTTALNETGDSSGALKVIEEAGTADPKLLENSYLRLQEGVALTLLEKPKEGLEVLRKAEGLAQDPDLRGFVLMRQGLALEKLGEHAEAVTQFDKALALMPPSPLRSFAWLHKAASHLALKDQSATNEALDQAAKDQIQQSQFFFMKASLLKVLGRYNEALNDFTEVTNLDPLSPQAWEEKAALLLRLERFPEALEAVEKTITLAPDAASKSLLLTRKAFVLLKKNDFEAALAALAEAVENDPNVAAGLKFIDIKTQVLLGLGRRDEIDDVYSKVASDAKLAADPAFHNAWAVALLLIGKNKDAFERMEEIAAHDPEGNDAAAWLICGAVRSDLGHFREALDALERVRHLDPSFEVNLRYLAALSMSFSGTGQHVDALETADALVAFDGKDPTSRLLRGIALAGLGRHKEALEEFDNVSNLASNTVMPNLFRSAALSQKGQVLLRMKQFEDALVAYRSAAELAEEVDSVPNLIGALLGQGFALYGRSTTEQKEQAKESQAAALVIATEAVERSKALPNGPIPALAWWAKGNILSWMERDEEALLAYQQGSEWQPKSVQIRLSLGEAYERLQDYEAALKAFEQATKDADLPDEKSEVYLGKARTLHRLERYEEALQACRDAIRANGENEKVLELLGTAYMKLNRNDAALRTFRRGWAMGKPNHRSAALALGVSAALLAENRNTEARAFLESAEKDTRFSGRLHFNYGVTLYRLKNFGPAARALRKASNMDIAEAEEYADKLEGGGGQNRTWLDFWFGSAAWMRKPFGFALLILLIFALLPSFLKPDALAFMPWLDMSKDWKVMLIPIILLSTLLLLPILKRVSVKGMEFDISQPDPQVGRPDLDTALKAFQEASPTTALTPGTREQDTRT